MATYRVTDLLPPGLPPSHGHVKAVVSLIWPYSLSADSMSILLVDADFRRRNYDGQVRLQLRGPSAVACKSLELDIGDTIRFALEGARWVEKDDAVTTSTPGHDKRGELLFNSRCMLSIERDGREISRMDVDEPNHELYKHPTPPLPPFETPKISKTYGRPSSWHTPKLRRSVSDDSYWRDDPFGESKDFPMGRPEKRPRFSRPSREWRFVLEEDVDPFILDKDWNQVGPTEQRQTPPPVVVVGELQSESRLEPPSPLNPSSQPEESPHEGGNADLKLDTALDMQKHLARDDSEAPRTPLAPRLQPLKSPGLPVLSPVTPIASNPLEPTIGQMERSTFARPLVLDTSLPNIDSIVELTDRQVELHEDGGGASRFSPDINVPSAPNSDDLMPLEGLLQHEHMNVTNSPTAQPSIDTELSVGSGKIRDQGQPAQISQFVSHPQRSADDQASMADIQNEVYQAYHRTSVSYPIGILTPDASQGEVLHRDVPDHRQYTNHNNVNLNTLITPQASQLERPFSQTVTLEDNLGKDDQDSNISTIENKPSSVFSVNIGQSTNTLETNRGLDNDNIRTTRSKVKHSSNNRSGEVPKAASSSAISPVRVAARRRSSLTTQPVTMFHQSSQGLRTRSAYYSPLSTMEHHLNHLAPKSTVDVIAVVTSFTSKPEKAKTGPRDYSTTFHISEPAYYPKTLQVQAFRPSESSLPAANVGDVALLRNFYVRSRKRRCVLVSGESSAWCIWRLSANLAAEERLAVVESRLERGLSTAEECNGPPVELGDDERQHVANLNVWWDTTQKESTALESA